MSTKKNKLFERFQRYKERFKRGTNSMSHQLFAQAVVDYYKTSSEALNQQGKKDIRRKSLN